MNRSYRSAFNRDYKDLTLAPQLASEQRSPLMGVRKGHWLAAAGLLAFIGWLTTSSIASVNPAQEPVPTQTAAPESVAEIEAETPVDTGRWINHTIKRNETLGTIFAKHNFDAALPLELTATGGGERLKSIRVGKELRFHLNDNGHLDQVVYPIDSLTDFVIQVNTDTNDLDQPAPKYQFSEQIKSYDTIEVFASGSISTSLYEAAEQNGVPIPVIMQMVDVFGWDIDFALGLREGDSFRLIYEEYTLDDEKLGNGNIIAAQFVNRGEPYQAIHFVDSEGNANYYTPEGESMRGTFQRTPVEFSRISSRFSLSRFHPILKTWRSHKGVDYAAPNGTPIRATAEGTIQHVGTKGGYGKTVIISHAGRFSTLYGHMSGYKKGIRSGVSIKQGEIIGYVGSTGLATGPHLHYEFRVNGVHSDPLKYKFPKASPVPDKDRLAFEARVNAVSAKLNRPDSTLLALADNKNQ